MTNQSKLHPGEFSRDIAKWHRGVIADIKQLTRGITRGMLNLMMARWS